MTHQYLETSVTQKGTHRRLGMVRTEISHSLIATQSNGYCYHCRCYILYYYVEILVDRKSPFPPIHFFIGIYHKKGKGPLLFLFCLTLVLKTFFIDLIISNGQPFPDQW